MLSTDTIFAPASGFGRAAVAVIRISGGGTRFALETIAGGVPEPRRMSLRRLRDPETGSVLDEALVVFFPGPGSFTGEDGAELHIHGGAAVRAGVLRSLGRMPGCRAAEAGEFTRRAFLNGRMDLPAVEGLADLIDAQTEAQARQALRQLGGELGRQVESWREDLIGALADLEAALDFADEGDVPASLEARAGGAARRLAGEIEAVLRDSRRGERLREGFVVVLAGPPNAGKSSLLNALARRDAAIVSPVPGTTRDAIEVACDLGGLPVTFIDTAGLRETEDVVEREGIVRTRARLDQADAVLWLDPVDDPCPPPAGDPRYIHLRTKSDLSPAAGQDLRLSARTGDGIPELLDLLSRRAGDALGTGDALVTRERHRRALERCAEALRRAVDALAVDQGELAAEDVRLALRALGEITGRVDVEAVLDRLFAAFCIGK
ncbi:tRNA uridine-5-carboxymethylaminomethyl(34) synthesis GTPase MnmE [Salinarimonas soli]|uniref:tRNA modification GTPase MnmE n=1 Tax=Salinarimonas soli TaxID=1638099 RepID=A0A5B2VG34_9HYPH|nr:tRNA uridine-5-carboxymethylaminomethyl(34) synthesis GTPase MnmE [Salinarimonas soli]KAA2237845.1 tRNA uridine-5-carboxymethylaminomethyl(34) synthesis GTPase MnmE [Salinarimonas soli]